MFIIGYLLVLIVLFCIANQRTWFSPDFFSGLGYVTPQIGNPAFERYEFRFRQGWELCGRAFFEDKAWKLSDAKQDQYFLSDLSMEDDEKEVVELGWRACSEQIESLLKETTVSNVKYQIVAPSISQWLFIFAVMFGFFGTTSLMWFERREANRNRKDSGTAQSAGTKPNGDMPFSASGVDR